MKLPKIKTKARIEELERAINGIVEILQTQQKTLNLTTKEIQRLKLLVDERTQEKNVQDLTKIEKVKRVGKIKITKKEDN